MAYDKTWNFTKLNQNPSSQDTLQHQCQSFLYFLQNCLKAIGWSILAYSDDNSVTLLPTVLNYHTLTTLTDGRVLVTGGSTSAAAYLSATYFGTISGNTITWVDGTVLPQGLYGHTLTLLNDGRILLTGGVNNGGSPQTTTYFGTITGNSITWVSSNALLVAVNYHRVTLLSDGRVLLTGGYSAGTIFATSYFGTISGNTITWVAGTALPQATYGHGFIILSDDRVVLVGGYNNSSQYQNNTYFGTIAGNAITWVASTAIPVAMLDHTLNILADGRLIIAAGKAASGALATTYFGTISGNTIAWVGGTALPQTTYQHASAVLNDGRLFISGGLNPGVPIGTIYLSTVSGNTITYYSNTTFTDTVGFPATNVIRWNQQITARSWILLASPVGFVAGPDGSSLGAQSQMYLCIECVSSGPTDYVKINLTWYSAMPTYGNSHATIPTGGNAQTIVASGMAFNSVTLTAARFHFASTAAGGWYAGISSIKTGIMPLILGFLDLADVQLVGANPHPYAAVGFIFYSNVATNMNYAVFDGAAGGNGSRCWNVNGAAGSPRAMVLGSPSGVLLIGNASTNYGDINGLIPNSPIYIYNALTNNVAVIGRIPDFKATDATGITASNIDNFTTPNYTYIYKLLIPSTAPILT